MAKEEEPEWGGDPRILWWPYYYLVGSTVYCTYVPGATSRAKKMKKKTTYTR